MHTIAILGCGRISASHVVAIKKVEDLELVACCDILRERAEKTADEAGCAAYADYSAMLKNEKIDLVALCTPSGLHPAHAITAAEAGVNVLSEKPLGTSLKEVDKAISACDRAGVLYMEVKQNRLNPTIVLLRKALEAGRFGRIHMITSNVFWTRPQEYYDMAPWRGTWEFDGGCLANQAAHYVDMVQWMGGAVEDVHAFSSTLGRRIEAEDTITVGLKFRNGAVGNINVSVLTYPHNLEGSITIMGDKGTAKIGGVAMNKVEQWSFDTPHPMDNDAELVNYDPQSVYGGGHYVLYKDLPRMLNSTVQSYGFVTAREGRKTIAILERAYYTSHDSSGELGALCLI